MPCVRECALCMRFSGSLQGWHCRVCQRSTTCAKVCVGKIVSALKCGLVETEATRCSTSSVQRVWYESFSYPFCQILESSQSLLHVLKREASELTAKEERSGKKDPKLTH